MTLHKNKGTYTSPIWDCICTFLDNIVKVTVIVTDTITLGTMFKD